MSAFIRSWCSVRSFALHAVIVLDTKGCTYILKDLNIQVQFEV